MKIINDFVINNSNINFENTNVISNMVFNNCFFLDISITKSFLGKKRKLNDISFNNCKFENVISYSIILNKINFNNIIFGKEFILYGCFLNQVKFSGDINYLFINNLLINKRKYNKWLNESKKFYNSKEWALDIKEANFFENVTIRGIPTQKIIRDNKTQKILTRENGYKLLQKKINYKSTILPAVITSFLDGNDENCLLIAPKISKNFYEYLEIFDDLDKYKLIY